MADGREERQEMEIRRQQELRRIQADFQNERLDLDTPDPEIVDDWQPQPSDS